MLETWENIFLNENKTEKTKNSTKLHIELKLNEKLSKTLLWSTLSYTSFNYNNSEIHECGITHTEDLYT